MQFHAMSQGNGLVLIVKVLSLCSMSQRNRWSNFMDYIKESDNDKNSNQEAEVNYHNWHLLPEDSSKDILNVSLP